MESVQENQHKQANCWLCEVLVGWKRWKHVFCLRLQDSFISPAAKKAVGDMATSKSGLLLEPFSFFQNSPTSVLCKPFKEQLCQVCAPFYIMAHSGPWGPTPNRKDKEERSNTCRCAVSRIRAFPAARWRFFYPSLPLWLFDWCSWE